jgi:hypothetical protein
MNLSVESVVMHFQFYRFQFTLHTIPPWSRVLEKLVVVQLIKKVPARPLWNLMIYYSVHKFRPLRPVPDQINPFHILFLFLYKTILSSRLYLDLSSRHFPLSFLAKVLYTFFIAPVRAACLILLDCLVKFEIGGIYWVEMRNYGDDCVILLALRTLRRRPDAMQWDAVVASPEWPPALSLSHCSSFLRFALTFFWNYLMDVAQDGYFRLR